MEPNCIVLDSGALAQEETAVRRFLERAVERYVPVVVPAVVLAECAMGTPKDASLYRALKPLDIIATDERIAIAASALRHALRLSREATIDAIVVATADSSIGSVVLTNDLGDLRALAGVRGRTRVEPAS